MNEETKCVNELREEFIRSEAFITKITERKKKITEDVRHKKTFSYVSDYINKYVK